jgi:hypothetical protein
MGPLGPGDQAEQREVSGVKKQTALMRLILVGAVAIPSVGSAAAPNDATSIKSIIFGGHTIDRVRTIKQRNWTIGFGPGRPFAASSEQGMTLHGLRYANATVGTVQCHIFMAMRPFESRAHFCEVAPDDRRASNSWMQYIGCPSEIKFGR